MGFEFSPKYPLHTEESFKELKQVMTFLKKKERKEEKKQAAGVEKFLELASLEASLAVAENVPNTPNTLTPSIQAFIDEIDNVLDRTQITTSDEETDNDIKTFAQANPRFA